MKVFGFSVHLPAALTSSKSEDIISSDSSHEMAKKNSKQTAALVKSGVSLAIETQNAQVLQRLVLVINSSSNKEKSVLVALETIGRALKRKSEL